MCALAPRVCTQSLWATLWINPGTSRQNRARIGLQRTARKLGSRWQRILASIVTGFAVLTDTPAFMPATALLCLVIAISDGDSFTARCGSPGAYEKVRVRIAAIDAPEYRQAYGQRARQQLARLCWRQQARIEPVDHDHYGRTVAQVQCQGQDAASTQVRAGMAWVYAPRAQAYPHLDDLQRQARAQHQGLWADAQPVPPWQYRHRQR